MNRRRFVGAGAAFLGACQTSARASANPRDMIRLHRAGSASPPATLADMAWLQGAWTGAMPGAQVEHIFLPPHAGQVPSFVRATNGEGIVFYEIANFVEAGRSLKMRLRHFDRDLVGWEDATGAIERPLIALDAETLFFHRATYQRNGEEAFTVYFLNMDGEEERETLVIPFHRTGG